MLRITGPPGPKLLAAEGDRPLFVEVGLVAGVDERGHRRRVVQRRRADDELVQRLLWIRLVRQAPRRLRSGWPDSNRRLLRPKRSTLTRLSYTPSLERAYSVTVRADKFALGNLRENQAAI